MLKHAAADLGSQGHVVISKPGVRGNELARHVSHMSSLPGRTVVVQVGTNDDNQGFRTASLMESIAQ